MSDTEDKKVSEFAIVLTPEFEQDGSWNGSVQCHMEEELQQDLSAEDTDKVRSVLGLLATCLQIMEEEENFLDYVQEQFLLRNPDILSQFAEDETPNFTKEGNVVHLNFSTKTYGSA